MVRKSFFEINVYVQFEKKKTVTLTAMGLNFDEGLHEKQAETT
jgi:hypothetical protein